jgi:hypothetical protein
VSIDEEALSSKRDFDVSLGIAERAYKSGRPPQKGKTVSIQNLRRGK